MKAIDTNVAIRVITGDHPVQSPLAASVLREGTMVTSGVWIEIEWVLRSAYRMGRPEIVHALTEFLNLDGVVARDDQRLRWAIGRYAEGAVWADMVHLVDCAESSAFVTFDRALPDLAGRETPVAIETLR